MPETRWNLEVSAETDESLRQFLADRGNREDISVFVEEAVHAHILELSSREARLQNTGVIPEDIDAIVDQAVHWARHG